jgi:hypothetical protein
MNAVYRVLYGINPIRRPSSFQLIGASRVIGVVIGGVMRRPVVRITGVAAIIATVSAIALVWNAAADQPGQQPYVARPWQTGSCYRVFRIVNEPPELFKVLAPPEGSWVRVEADPKAPWVPGSRPAAPVWLNINSVFVLQEWPCSQFPYP